jgi:hypothetical protein
MAYISVRLNRDLVAQARALTQARTNREAVELALQEFVRRRQLHAVIDLMGSDLVGMDDEQLRQWRNSSLHRISS